MIPNFEMKASSHGHPVVQSSSRPFVSQVERQEPPHEGWRRQETSVSRPNQLLVGAHLRSTGQLSILSSRHQENDQDNERADMTHDFGNFMDGGYRWI